MTIIFLSIAIQMLLKHYIINVMVSSDLKYMYVIIRNNKQ